ncbi:Uncharacterised protein [uncultured Clostridium sp.]|nr:Uncharacterised protein [uncultured Clostridium sp.]
MMNKGCFFYKYQYLNNGIFDIINIIILLKEKGGEKVIDF